MRNPPDAVMIFAAGFGTRMKELTRDRPKPLIEVAGKALIDHALDLVDEAELPHRVANVHYKPDALITRLQARGVDISDERSRILETGGGLKRALPYLPSGAVFTMNSDAIFRGPNPFACLRDVWASQEMDALLLLVPPSQAHGTDSTGDFRFNDTGRLSRGSGLIYSGIQIINTSIVADMDETVFSLNVVWNQIGERDRLFGAIYPGEWCDVGHPGGIPIAERMLGKSDV